MLGALLLNIRAKSGPNRAAAQRNQDYGPPRRPRSIWAIRRDELNEIAKKVKEADGKRREKPDAELYEGESSTKTRIEAKQLQKEIKLDLSKAEGMLNELATLDFEPLDLMALEQRTLDKIRYIKSLLALNNMPSQADAMQELARLAYEIQQADAAALVTILALNEVDEDEERGA